MRRGAVTVNASRRLVALARPPKPWWRPDWLKKHCRWIDQDVAVVTPGHLASTTIPSLVLKLTLLSVNMSSIQFPFLGCEICKWTCHLTVGHIQHLVLKNLYRRPSPDLCCPVVTVTSTGSASQDQALYMGDYQRWKYDVAEWNGIICDKKLKLSFVAGCRITTMNDLPIGNLYVMMLITIIKGSWLWNASDHDVENENDWHRLALIGIVRHAGGESLYIYYFTSREDNLSLWVIVTTPLWIFDILTYFKTSGTS